MDDKTRDAFQNTLGALIDANPHARNKGDKFKNWAKKCFDLDARISYIKEQRQITNRVSEQFRYFAPIVVFVCVGEVSRDTLMRYILERVYKQLETVAIIGATQCDEKKEYKYEQLIVFKENEFSNWMAQFFDSTKDADKLAGELGVTIDPLDEFGINFAWYVGTTGNDEEGKWKDFSEEYIEQGIWVNGWSYKFEDVVNSIKVGDRIAIKSSFTQKYNLPFDNHGKVVGAMRIKAIGVVTENCEDGKNIKVEWTRLDPLKTWYGPGTLRETIHAVKAGDGYVKKQLLDFTFADAEQDYSICEERYNDETDSDTNNDETLIEEIPPVDENQRNTDGENVLLYGVPGCGKSWTIAHEYCNDDDCMERLVFHPDYMYSDFVGQILPVVRDDKVRYEFTPGPFVKLLKKAYWNPTKSYFLIIEEINRGNAPAIFGEIFQLLDRKTKDGDGFRRGTSEYGITNANIAHEVYGDENIKVRIPGNMSIIGTMNTSDQNVFTLDTAFQRRWIMRMIPNSFKDHEFAGNPILDTGISWQQFCEAINDEILRRNNITSSEDKRLGAYFITEDDLVLEEVPKDATEIEKKRIEHKNSRFAEKVIKYLWDDAFRFSHPDTFDTRNYNSLESVIDGFMSTTGKTRFRVYHENLRKQILEDRQTESNIVSEENEGTEN